MPISMSQCGNAAGTALPELPIELLAGCDDAEVVRSAAAATQSFGGSLRSLPSAEVAAACMQRHVDGIVIDAPLEQAVNLIRKIRDGGQNRNSVIFACVNSRSEGSAVIEAGATFIFYKPLATEALLQVLGLTYSKTTQRRRRPRFEVSAPVDLAHGRTQYQATLVNLSETGMAVRCTDLSFPGKTVGFSFQLPDGPRVDGEGEIVWCSSAGMIGVNFENLSGVGDLAQWLAGQEQ